MSALSLTIRLALCCVVALVSLPGLDQGVSDFLFRLRGPLRTPTDLRLVKLASDDNRETVLRHLQEDRPRLLVFYPDEALVEDTVPDRDCTLRHASLEGGTTPSPTLLSYHRLNATSGKPAPVFPVAVDFRGPAGSYPTFTEGQALITPSGTFTNRIVLVGRDRGQELMAQTPFGSMAPLEVQANILESLWKNRTLRRSPLWLEKLGALATVAISVAILLYLPLSYAWLPLLLLGGLWVALGCFLLAQFQWVLGIGSPLMAIVFSHFLLLGFKVKRQEAQHWRTRKEAEYARQLDEFKNNFVSLFSHDLKTPIARIKAVVQLGLAESEATPVKVQDALRNIDRASDDLARLIGDILKVTKMESMSMELQKDAVDINRMVESAVARLKYVSDEKKIHFLLDLEPLFPIEGDPQLIQEIILNLAENAVKYGRPQSEVLIRTSEELGRVRITVTDQGDGIPADELPRVTGKFYRGKTVAQNSSGSGLGLYLAKYFVEMHQGELEIKSQLGKGTEVSFWLPSPT